MPVLINASSVYCLLALPCSALLFYLANAIKLEFAFHQMSGITNKRKSSLKKKIHNDYGGKMGISRENKYSLLIHLLVFLAI